MKLLFDQNLSFRLVGKLANEFPDSGHVRLLGMEEADDRVIWQYARDNDLIIVTQDADFDGLAQVHGFPPKIIWLRCGNTSTANILHLLLTNYDLIKDFNENDQLACLEIW
jgi:predicted nuclease of predicted toxin-antitoxin system